MKTLRIYLALAFLIALAACKKDTTTLPASELIMGQWKWISFSLKGVDADGKTTTVVSQSFPPTAYVKFEAPDIFYDSEDGVNVETNKWSLDEVNNKITIADVKYKIIRLDTEYLIIQLEIVDSQTQIKSIYSHVYKR